MNRIKSILRAFTFVKIKLVIIISILIGSILFGISHLSDIDKERESLMECINQIESDMVERSELLDRILIIDNELLTKSLNNEISTEHIGNDINLMNDYAVQLMEGDSLVSKLSDLIYESGSVLVKIVELKDVDVNNFTKNEKVEVISKNIKKGIFREKVDYDTIVKTYKSINANLYSKKKELNSIEINRLIVINNELTLDMKLLIDEYNTELILESFEKRTATTLKLIDNSKYYIITSIFVIVVVILLLYLIVSDIRKIKKSDKRKKDTLSFLISEITRKNR